MDKNRKEKIIIIAVVIIIILSVYFIAAMIFNWFPFNKVYYPVDGKLDNSFVFNMTENLSNIVFVGYNESAGEIAKGRFFGSKGEHLAADILKNNLTIFGFDKNHINKGQIENIWYPYRCIDLFLNLTTKLDVIYQNLTVINQSSGEEKIINDFYISPRWNISFLNPFYDRKQLTHIFNETNLTVLHHPPNSSYIGPWNLTWFDNFFLNTSIQESIIENYSNMDDTDDFAKWLGELFEQHYNQSYASIIEIENNYLLIEEDRAFNPNPKIPAWEPTYLIDDDEALVKLLHTYSELLQLKYWSKANPKCKGIIRYDFNNDTYDMNLHRYYAIPIIYTTGKLGREINKSVNNFKINYTLGQRYNESVISYNIIGKIDGIDNSKTVIISCLYDSWWNQGTADSAIGMSIVWAIAKYIKNLEKQHIKPYYTTKFIAFSGEEYGRVGARFYDQKYRDENIYAVIDVNQVGFNNSDQYKNRDLTLKIWTNQPNNLRLRNKIWNIVNRTNYTDKTEVNLTINSNFLGGYVGNQWPFALNRPFATKTIYFVKDYNWTYHHRDGRKNGTGSLHSEGDVMEYYYDRDVEITGEMILNVTIGFNPLVFSGVDVYIPFIITFIIIAIIVILIWKKEFSTSILKWN